MAEVTLTALDCHHIQFAALVLGLWLVSQILLNDTTTRDVTLNDTTRNLELAGFSDARRRSCVCVWARLSGDLCHTAWQS